MAEVSMQAGATIDYEAAYGYFAQRGARATESFAAAFQKAVASLRDFPALHPLVDEKHRRCALGTHPLGLIYRVEGGAVIVVALHYDHQRPRDWARR